MSNDNYNILPSDSGLVVLECENKDAIEKFFNEKMNNLLNKHWYCYEL